MRRLVTHENPESRPTPTLLLSELRRIDPDVELVYFGDRNWRLGSVSPNAERARRGEAILKFEESRDVVHRNPRNLFLGRLLQQGFAQIAEYTDLGDVSGTVLDAEGQHTTILADFAARHDAWIRDGGEEIFKQRLAVTHGDAREAEQRALMQQYLATDGRAHYRREMRGRRVFASAGLTP